MTQTKLIKTMRRKPAQQKGWIVGRPVPPPASVSSRYAKTMQALVKLCANDYANKLMALEQSAFDAPADKFAVLLKALRSKWSKVFTKHAETMAGDFIADIATKSSTSTWQAIREMTDALTLKPPKFSEAMQKALDVQAKENVSLIKDLGKDIHDRMAKAVAQSVHTGGLKSIYDEAMLIEGMTSRRAVRIAVDQTKKLHSKIADERMRAAGVGGVQWFHSSAVRVPRPLHVSYHGKIFDLNDPPVIDLETGERGWGGVLIGCQCFTAPAMRIGGL